VLVDSEMERLTRSRDGMASIEQEALASGVPLGRATRWKRQQLAKQMAELEPDAIQEQEQFAEQQRLERAQKTFDSRPKISDEERNRVARAEAQEQALNEADQAPNRWQNIVPRAVSGVGQTAVSLGGMMAKRGIRDNPLLPGGNLISDAIQSVVGDPTLAAADFNEAIRESTDETFPAPRDQQRFRARTAGAEGVLQSLGVALDEPVGALQEALEQAGTFLPAVRAAGVVGGSGAVTAAMGGQAAAQEFDQEFRQGIIQRSPEYQELAKQVGEDQAYRELKARRVELSQGLQGTTGAATAGLTSRLGFNPVDDLVAGQARRTSGGLANIVREAAGEGLIEEPADALARNIAARSTGSDRDVLEGVPESAAQGFALGAITGGLFESPNIARRAAEQARAAITTRAKRQRAEDITSRILGDASPDEAKGAAIVADAFQRTQLASAAEIDRALQARTVDQLLTGGDLGDIAADGQYGAGNRRDDGIVGPDVTGGVEPGLGETERTLDGLRRSGNADAGSAPGALPARQLTITPTGFVAGDPDEIRSLVSDAGLTWKGKVRVRDGRPLGIQFGKPAIGDVSQLFAPEQVTPQADAPSIGPSRMEFGNVEPFEGGSGAAALGVSNGQATERGVAGQRGISTAFEPSRDQIQNWQQPASGNVAITNAGLVSESGARREALVANQPTEAQASGLVFGQSQASKVQSLQLQLNQFRLEQLRLLERELLLRRKEKREPASFNESAQQSDAMKPYQQS